MRLIYILFFLLSCCVIGEAQFAGSTLYYPVPGTYNVAYNETITFYCSATDDNVNTKLSLKVTIENALYWGSIQILEYTQHTSFFNQPFDVQFKAPNVEAIVKVTWYSGDIGSENKIWRFNVGSIPAPPDPAPTLNLSGPSEMQENAIVTFTADYSKHTSSTRYTWLVDRGLSIVGGQGTNRITVRSDGGQGPKTINVSAGGLNTAKTVNVTSSTVNVSNQNIVSNQSYSGEVINITNTSISNNAIVSFSASSVVNIYPNFSAREGTRVTIKALGNATRSSEFVDDSIGAVSFLSDDDYIDNIEPDVKTVLSNNVLSITQSVLDDVMDCIEIYNISGILVHKRKVNSSIENFNMYNCSNGIYIIRVCYKNGKILSRKIMLNR